MREPNQPKVISIRPIDHILRRQIERLATLERRTFSQMGRILLEDAVAAREEEQNLSSFDATEEGSNESGHAA